MKEEYEDVITHYLKTWPVRINSKAFTAQNRLRYYWTSFHSPTAYGELDIISKEASPSIQSILDDVDYAGVWTWPRGYNKGGTRFVDKMPCITTSSWQHNFLVEKQDGSRRKFTPIECERAQGLPNGYTNTISDNQRYVVLGNGWTVPVIEHLLSKNIKPHVVHWRCEEAIVVSQPIDTFNQETPCILPTIQQ
ncbi:C-5 cytosine-specific DNA methylase [compost metagenome]